MVVLASWGVAVFVAFLYVRFGTKDLDILNDGFKIGVYKAAVALMIIRGILFLARDWLW